jgi:hypothetical protein
MPKPNRAARRGSAPAAKEKRIKLPDAQAKMLIDRQLEARAALKAVDELLGIVLAGHGFAPGTPAAIDTNTNELIVVA